MKKKVTIFWLRRDLRLHDNAGLYYALKSGKDPVLPLFIFDEEILGKLEDEDDARVTFIHDTITGLSEELTDLGSSIIVRHGKPIEIWKDLLKTYEVSAVFTNHDYEPYAEDRDAAIAKLLDGQNIGWQTYKDHVIFEKGEILKGDGDPYIVFTPFKRKWLEKLSSRPDSEFISFYFKPYPNEEYFDQFIKMKPVPLPSLSDIGFVRSQLDIPSTTVPKKTIREYDKRRDFPGMEGTSKLGVHFRFGTISIREKARKAYKLNATFLSELIWRDFYAQILAFFPHVVDGCFRPKYDQIPWRNNEVEFVAWCEGLTGYPMVDAGMRELNATGYMHNRVRMVVASFLTKHLLINWQWGEAYFARKLLDFDLASNNGGWQWAAGCGTDAAPYFRIFNPESQFKKFDPKAKYVGKWVPEFDGFDYVQPIVDHKEARERCLRVYKEALG